MALRPLVRVSPFKNSWQKLSLRLEARTPAPLWYLGMHVCTTPIMRKKLADPAACGVRLGVELRAAAEQEAYRSGMCLSHWIKRIVQEAVRRSGREKSNKTHVTNTSSAAQSVGSDPTSLESAFQREMEKLNER